MASFMVVGLLNFSAPTLAQAGNPEDTIVVTGRGLSELASAKAYASQTFDRDVLLASASGRIEDTLAATAGLQQFRRSDSRSANPSAQGLTLRGLGGNASSRTLVLLDGVPMADPFFGYIPFSALTPDRLASLRVTRGGGAGAFGAGAVAGTLELTSAEADALGLFGAAALINDRAESELSGTLAPRLGAGFAVLGARWDRGQGFWTTPLSQRSAASARAATNSWSTSLQAVAPLGASTELQARGMLFDDRRTLRFSGADSTSSGQDASIRIVGRGSLPFEALAYVQARDFSNVVISATTFRPTLNQRATPSTGWGGKVELRPAFGEIAMRIGTDWRVSTGTMLEDAVNATGTITARRSAGGRNSDVGTYVEGENSLGHLTLTFGARADRWSIANGFFREANTAGTVTTDNRFANRGGWQSSFRGGAVWQAGPDIRLRASAYSGLRLPTLNELYRPFTVFPVTTRANAALINERLRGFEAGLDVEPFAGASLSLTAFDNRLKHAIANVTIGTNLRERRNVDAVRARGIEANGALSLGTISFEGALSWTDARLNASGILDGKRPAQVPRLSASGGLSWRPRNGTRLSLRVQHTGLQFEDDLETDRLPAVTTLSAFAELPVTPGLALVLRGENLTGAEVITRNQAGSIDLGAPRTVWAGLRFKLP